MLKTCTIPLMLLCLLATSCKQGSKPVKADEQGYSQAYAPLYAKGFSLLVSEAGDKLLKVSNPWQGAEGVEFVYKLVANPTEGDVSSIKCPAERVVCLSSTHIAFIDALGKTDAIIGVSGSRYISNADVVRRFTVGEVVDVGYESSLSYELLASLKPDVVLAYGVDGEMAGVEKKLNEMGVKLVYIGEYMEQTPLGKAEWMVPVAAILGVEEQAIQLFKDLAVQYESLKDKVEQHVGEKPKVMLNAPFKGTWYVPGGESYMACLLHDAGSDYLYAASKGVESFPTSLEQASLKAQEADYWLNPNAVNSLRELEAQDRRLTDVPAFRLKKVYNNNARSTEGGGSDFWESGVVQPDIILKDMVKIFHPQLVDSTYRLYYFKHLE